MISMVVKVIEEECTGCESCIEACPIEAIEMVDGIAKIKDTCNSCNACIEACPVDPDPSTGRRALYRNSKTLAITVDPDRCIGCEDCAGACRVGVIVPHAETALPERMCTLCNGEPQCVKHCPFEALSHVKVDINREFYGMKPRQIAEKLIKEWYADSDKSGHERRVS